MVAFDCIVLSEEYEVIVLCVKSSFTTLFEFQIEHKISLQQLAERLGVNFDVVRSCVLYGFAVYLNISTLYMSSVTHYIYVSVLIYKHDLNIAS